jgi:hypothetical protein
MVNLYEFCSYNLIGKLTVFLQLQESSIHNMIVKVSTTVTRAFSSQFKEKTDSILGKVSALRFILNIDRSSIISKSHTHLSPS